MNDTPPKIAERVREMLMARSHPIQLQKISMDYNDQLLRHATLMLTPSIKARSKIGAVLTGRDMRRGDESMLSLDRTKEQNADERLLSEVTSVLEVSGLNIVLEEKLPAVTRENACASLCCKRMFTPSKDLSSQI